MFYNSPKGTLAILSAEISAASPESNARSTAMLRCDLENEGLLHIPSLGFYKGHREQSNVVLITKPELLELIMRFARMHGQESVLVRNSDDSVELHYTNGQIERLKGTFQKVSDSDYLKYDAWTEVAGKYYTVK